MKPKIGKFEVEAEYFSEENCFVNELYNSAADAAVSIARIRVLPGEITKLHRLHHTTERYVILAGSGIVEIDELPKREVQIGDVVSIPPMCRQRITNSGAGDLIFLAVCSPRFIPQNYEELDY
ncbi:MAG TPA: cupin domain-containing protein [Candidatus Cloacimonadota bacterium]|nr:cupin domain-containing protein [Candidatus Cloacimonadota bacterium]